MAKKVSELPAASALSGAELVLLVQDAASVRTTATELKEFILSGSVKITVSTVAPSSPAVGDLWVDSN